MIHPSRVERKKEKKKKTSDDQRKKGTKKIEKKAACKFHAHFEAFGALRAARLRHVTRRFFFVEVQDPDWTGILCRVAN